MMPPASGLRVLLIGEESAGAQTLKALAGSRHQVVAVNTSAEPDGLNTSLASVAQRLGYPTRPAAQVKDPSFADWLQSAGVDIIVNVHSLYIVHDRVLRAARIGAFNLHPGPLPEYAGLNTVSWAIYRGETSYGVTLHWMEPGIDTGDITCQAVFPLEETDTPLRLMHKCVEKGVPLLLSLLETAAADPQAIPRIPQDLTRRRYFGKRPPEGGLLSWSRPAAEIVSFVRACDYSPFPSPWGRPATTIAGRDVEVIKAARTYQACPAPPGTLARCDESGALIAAADEWVAVLRLRAGGRTAAPLEILEGVLR